jgi:uncharacterized sulfatase
MVFVIADDGTIWDIGCYGGQAHTPNIDKLATEWIANYRSDSSILCLTPPVSTRTCNDSGVKAT